MRSPSVGPWKDDVRLSEVSIATSADHQNLDRYGRAMSKYSAIAPAERLPEWLRRPIGNASELERVQGLVKQNRLHTICEGAMPQPWRVLRSWDGHIPARWVDLHPQLRFVRWTKVRPLPVDAAEAERVADAVEALQLRYVVLTAVARDDLDDHGATLFTQAMAAIRARNPLISIEVLTPDFWGGVPDQQQAVEAQRQRLATVLAADPVCFNHNLETVQRLQGEVRRGATYSRSLGLLAASRELAPQIPTKSGLMLGLGESRDEVIDTLHDLRAVDCQRITLGQYLRPSMAHIPVSRYWTPEEFDALAEVARELGFAQVRSGPLVRSSYHAAE